MSWSTSADRVLARIFVRGQPAPTRQQIAEVYPFGERAFWPYKIWLKRVKAWRLAHSLGLSSPGAAAIRRAPRDAETLDVFGARS